MPSFAYVAREVGSGREIRNNMDAATEQAAVALLLKRNLLVLSIQEKMGRKGKTAGGKVALADLVMFTRQLATMMKAGVPLLQSFDIVGKGHANAHQRHAKAHPCFIPPTIAGSDAGAMTFTHRCNRFDPIVLAARR